MSYYVDDKELKDIFDRMGERYHEVEGEVKVKAKARREFQ